LTRLPPKTPIPVAERPARGVIDTSVVLDLERLDLEALPTELAISALTLAELAGGPHVATDAHERAIRQDHLQRTEATFDALPFDTAAARAYGRVYAAVTSSGRKVRGARAVDLLIAATAADLPLYTRNIGDFQGLDDVVTVVAM